MKELDLNNIFESASEDKQEFSDLIARSKKITLGISDSLEGLNLFNGLFVIALSATVALRALAKTIDEDPDNVKNVFLLMFKSQFAALSGSDEEVEKLLKKIKGENASKSE